jgi:transposase
MCIADASGDIIAFHLTGGEASDARHFDVLLDIGPDIQPRAVICDKGYASKVNREVARKRGIAPVIPHKANERDKPAFFARTLYKARSRIEQGVGRLKRFKRVALRCEKTARNFGSIVSFAAGLCLIKFVHTA